MGIDRFVNPDLETARAFMSLVSTGADEGMVRFSGEDLILRSSLLGPSSPFVGRPLKESRASLPGPFLVAAVEGEDGTIIPSGDTVPEADQTIYILGSAKDLDRVLGGKSAQGPRYRRIVIAGAGAIGTLLAEGFLGMAEGKDLGLDPSAGAARGRRIKPTVTIVEPSFAESKRASRQVPGALILNRDLEDEDLFLEEGLSGADLFIATTPDQGLNLLSSARAKLFGVDRSLALAENNAYSALTERLGVDGVISIKSNVVSSIVEYLRGGVLTTLHSFFDRGLKILEFTVGQESRMNGASIRELRLPRGALAIFVKRAGRMTLPAADTRLSTGDRLGIFTRMETSESRRHLLGILRMKHRAILKLLSSSSSPCPSSWSPAPRWPQHHGEGTRVLLAFLIPAASSLFFAILVFVILPGRERPYFSANPVTSS
jgi:trk system potassium uptake protein TrkA